MNFEAFMAMMIRVDVFCFVTYCSVVVGYQRFGRPFCLHLRGEVNNARRGSIDIRGYSPVVNRKR